MKLLKMKPTNLMDVRTEINDGIAEFNEPVDFDDADYSWMYDDYNWLSDDFDYYYDCLYDDDYCDEDSYDHHVQLCNYE